MKSVRLMWWCAIVALGVGASVQEAAAQFAGQEGQDTKTQRSQSFAAAAPSSRAGSRPEIPCKCVGDPESSSAVANIKQALGRQLKPTGIDFQEQPLEDVVNFLQEEYGIPIQLDVPALEDCGIAADEPVTCNLQNISLKSALRLMLYRLNLTYVIENEVLVITSPEQAEENLVTCVYDVRDLVTDGRSFEALADAIESCIAQDTWARNGGGGAEIRPVQSGLLVVSQTCGAHDEIGELLAAIRSFRHGSAEGGTTPQTNANATATATEAGAVPKPAEENPFD